MGLFSWLSNSPEDCESGLASIFPLALTSDDFCNWDIVATYTKILTDAMERTHGLKEKDVPLLWDSAVQDANSEGLITMLSKAMSKKEELFLVVKEGVLRKADDQEREQIIADYKEKAESSTGVYISFKCYQRTTMLEIYSGLEYCVLSSLHKNMNISKAVQVKVAELRKSVSLNDEPVAKNQAKAIATALRKGLDVMMDAGDTIETAKPDVSATEKAMEFIDGKRAFILSLPMAYISGTQTGGIGSTGEADMRAVERGLKQYWASVLRPTLKSLFGTETKFKSQDFREINTAVEAVKAFELISDQLISLKSKQAISARLFDLDVKEEAKNIAEEDSAAAEPAPVKPVIPQQGK